MTTIWDLDSKKIVSDRSYLSQSPLSSDWTTGSESDSGSSSVLTSEYRYSTFVGNLNAFEIETVPKNPRLEITVQPIDKFRFRYESEGCHGSLAGLNQFKSKEQLVPTAYLHNFDRPAVIRCSLFQVDSPNPLPHTHSLSIKNRQKISKDLHVVGNKQTNAIDLYDVPVSRFQGFTAKFQGIGIIHTTKKFIISQLWKRLIMRKEIAMSRNLTELENEQCWKQAEKVAKRIDLNRVSLCFEAFEKVDDKLISICNPVYSTPIKNIKNLLTNELKIARLSTDISEADGGVDLFLFVEKVLKNNIKVRFFETNKYNEPIWEAWGKFSEIDVHHQFAIALQTPPYKNQDILENIDCWIQLVRPSDENYSARIKFQYKPRRTTYPSNELPTILNPNELPTILNPNELPPILNQPQTISTEVNESATIDELSTELEKATIIENFIGPDMDNDESAPMTRRGVVSRKRARMSTTYPSNELPPILNPNELPPILNPNELPPILNPNELPTILNPNELPTILNPNELPPILNQPQTISTEVNESATIDELSTELEKATIIENFIGPDKDNDESAPMTISSDLMVFLKRIVTLEPDQLSGLINPEIFLDYEQGSVEMKNLTGPHHMLKTDSANAKTSTDSITIDPQLKIILRNTNEISAEKIRSLFQYEYENSRFILDFLITNTPEIFKHFLNFVDKLNIADVLDYRNDHGKSCFHTVCENCPIETIADILPTLISLGVNPNLTDEEGDTVLHVLVRETNLINSINLLLKGKYPTNSKLNLEIRNDDSFTPLLLAARLNRLKAVEMLLDAGASINEVHSTDGNNILHIAVTEDSEDMVELILKRTTIDVTSTNNANQSPIDLALANEPQNGKILYLLNSKQQADKQFYSKNYPTEIKSEPCDDYPDILNFVIDEDVNFDEICSDELCNLFNTSEKWQQLARCLGFQAFVNVWTASENPSRILFKFSEVQGTTLGQMIDIFHQLNESTALMCVDEMITRRLENYD